MILVAGKGLVTNVYKVFMLIRIIFPAIMTKDNVQLHVYYNNYYALERLLLYKHTPELLNEVLD